MTLITYSGNYSKGGKSSVDNISYNSSRIIIYFRDIYGNRASYYYSRSDIGRTNYNKIKSLARAGVGLNRFVTSTSKVYLSARKR